jgi:SSS family transporter
MTVIDWLVIGAYGIIVMLFGFWASRKSGADETEYFLAGREQGWAAVAASTWATKLSALTFIGVPGAAIAGNFAYVQLWFGSFIAAYLVAVLFIPEFYRLRTFTVYEYLEHRLGPRSRLAGTIVFVISRCLASGVRLAGCAIAVSVFFDLPLLTAIVAIAVVASVYVLLGGLRAVIWTDGLQLVLFLSGAALAIGYVTVQLPGGFGQIIEAGVAANKFQIFDFRLDSSDATTFWAGNVFALVLGLAVGAADQDIAQRALSCANGSIARKAVIRAGMADLISTFLFLFVGVSVFAFYEANPSPEVSALISQSRHDYIFPHFIRNELPAGLRGLLVVGLFAAAMSSLDSALSGLASSAYFDLGFGRLLRGRSGVDRSRYLVIGFAIVLALIAAGLGSEPSILWFGLKIMGYTYGGLLGLFLLAYFMPRQVDDPVNVFAVMSSIAVVVAATQWGFGFGHLRLEPAPWTWAILIGLGWTIGAALVLSAARRRIFGNRRAD